MRIVTIIQPETNKEVHKFMCIGHVTNTEMLQIGVPPWTKAVH